MFWFQQEQVTDGGAAAGDGSVFSSSAPALRRHVPGDGIRRMCTVNKISFNGNAAEVETESDTELPAAHIQPVTFDL